MRTSPLLPLLIVLAGCGGDAAQTPPPATPATPAETLATAPVAPPAPPTPPSRWKYPATKTAEASDTYFGKTYSDPFRPLENLKDPETEAWFKAQATLTDGLLDAIPGRDALVQEWMALDKLKPADYSDFVFKGGRLFYKKTLGGESVGKLFYRDGWSGPEQLLFDPATYTSSATTAGKKITIDRFSPSWNGKYVALGLSSGGSEYTEVRILDIPKKALLAESIYPVRFSLGWTPDSLAIFYDAGKDTDIRSLTIEQNRTTRLHTLGKPSSTDKDVLGAAANPELGLAPKELPSASVSEWAPEYLLGRASTVQAEMKLFIAPRSELGQAKVKWTKLAELSDNLVRGFAFCGPDAVCAATHTDAPHYKIVRTSLKHPDWAHAETIIPEAGDTIQYLTRSRDFLFVVYSNGIVRRIVKYDLAKKTQSEVPLPITGTATISCPEIRSNRCLVATTGWTLPPTIYDFDAAKNAFTKSAFNSDVTYPGFDSLVTEEVEVPGHDGTMVPLSIVHKRGIPLDGSNSTILTGYGAYGTSSTPAFSIMRSIALHGVVLAIAHPRGGGEKGETWYKAGYKTTKPNTWKDFISAAEYLVQKGYTSKEKLAGTGTSAGGILISRAITERPDLFAAAVCNVGVANAMRVEFSPNGPVNIPEFGTVSDEAEATALYEMDGVQHVQKGVRYPALLGVGGWNDPRVSPWEPGKFVAAIQVASASDKPALLKINYDNGHFTEDKLVTFKNFASQYAFMLWQTGHKEFQPTASQSGSSPAP